MTYHKPVMLAECLEGLNINPGGIYVDVTFGGGGHSKAILDKIKTGRLLGFDQDPDANANALDDKRFTLVNHNFEYLKNYLEYHKAIPVNGLLADLGISSHQIDQPERGFSTRFDAQLDMRMDKDSANTAKDIINNRSEKDLHKIFGMYGEITNARELARCVVMARNSKPINTTTELKEAIKPCVKRGKENKYYAQVFQALRIEVNRELEVLKSLLTQSAEVMEKGGRLVVMSYHSLEDRLVKNFINKGKFSGEIEKDFYGNDIKPFKAINRKAITASEEEIAENPRARSAKLRIAERI